MTRQFVRVAAMGIAGCIALSAMADAFVWQGASGGSWNDAANWAGGVVPNASGAEVDFSAASGTYAVSVDAAVTVGKITLDPSATTTLTLSGSNITFAASSTPEVNVGANGTLALQNATGGNQGLRKTGAGLYKPTSRTSSYSGRTYVDGGTIQPVKDSSNATLGGSVEVASGAVFKWSDSDQFGSTFKTFANGGTFDLNGKFDYVGEVTLANGGLFKTADNPDLLDRFLVFEEANVAKMSSSGDGFAGTFKGRLVVSSCFLPGNREKISIRTQEVNVASANATLAMTGYIFDRLGQARYSDIYVTEYRNQNYPYRGQLMKTGAGDLLLYDETISLTGPTTVSAGRLILSNSVKMCASTIKLPNGNASLAVAEGAALKLSGLESPDGSSLDLNGATLDLGGTGEDAVFSGTLANGGTIRKTGPNSQTLSAPQTRNDWDVLGGTLHFGVPTPVVWYTFDDPDGLGRDSGTAGKQLSVSNAAGVAWSDGGVAGGCASFDAAGGEKAETAEVLPGGNSPFTIALWIKPTNSSYALVTWGNESGSQWNGFVSSGTTQLKHAFWEGASGDFVSDAIDGSFTDGKWRHVAVTYDPATGTRKFYVDGALLSSKTVAGTRKVAVGKPFYLGIGKYSSNFKGKMDDVMVFDRTLPAADIATLANWRRGGARAALTPAGGNIRLESGATVSFAHADESFASISGRGTLALHDATATIAPAANATNEVGRLAGDGTLVKNGAGTLALSRLRDAGGKLDVRAGTVTAKGPAANLRDNLVAWWTFDDPVNPGADASGNGLNVTSATAKAQNTYTCESWNWRNRFEKTGGAAYFDGVSTHYLVLVDAATAARLPSGNTSLTMALWIAPEAGCSTTGTFFGWGGATSRTTSGFRLHMDSDNLVLRHFFWSNDLSSQPLPSDFRSAAPPTGWHHVALVYDAATATRTFYLDGVAHGSAAVNNASQLNISPSNLSIGWFQGSAVFKGWMDDIMIFDKALSADEIRAVMQGVALEEPAGGMAAATASGTSFEVTDGQVAFSGLAATGTVSVAAAAEALFTGGENVLAGAVGGAGRLAVTNGASLSLAGGQNFGGTLDVRAGGTLALVPNANAHVQSLQLAEGTALAAQPAESSTAALVSTAAVALPEALTVRVAVPEPASGFSATLVEATGGLTGDVDDWTLDATLPAQGSWRASVRKIGNKVVLSVYPSGTYILFR